MTKRKFKIYFASPLFSDMERAYNSNIVNSIRQKFKKDVEIYLPQENEAINDKSGYADSKMIAVGDNKELINSDLVVAVLDGISIDNGVASEIGIAYALGIPVLALYTDSRQGTFGNNKKIEALDTIAESQFSYINLYTVGLIKSSNELHGDVLKDYGVYNNIKDLFVGIKYFVSLNKEATTLLNRDGSIDLLAVSTNKGVELIEYPSHITNAHDVAETNLRSRYGNENETISYRIILSKSFFPILAFKSDSKYYGQSLIRELHNIYNSFLLGHFNSKHYINTVHKFKIEVEKVYYVEGHHYDIFGLLKTAKSYKFKTTKEQYDNVSIGKNVVVPVGNYDGKNPLNSTNTIFYVTDKGIIDGKSKHPKTNIISVLNY